MQEEAVNYGFETKDSKGKISESPILLLRTMVKERGKKRARKYLKRCLTSFLSRCEVTKGNFLFGVADIPDSKWIDVGVKIFRQKTEKKRKHRHFLPEDGLSAIKPFFP